MPEPVRGGVLRWIADMDWPIKTNDIFVGGNTGIQLSFGVWLVESFAFLEEGSAISG